MQHYTLRQPYSPQSLLFRPRARSKVDWNKNDDADGEGKGEEDGKDEVGRCGSEREEVAEKKKDEEGDEGQDEKSKGIGAY